MTITPRAAVLLFCFLFPGPAIAGKQYFVQPDGDDARCDGSKASPASDSGRCAFRTLAQAMEKLKGGDDLQLGAGAYAERLVLPANLSAGASDPTIIAGDPNASRLDVIIAGVPGALDSIFSPGGSTRFLTLRHLRFKAGTRFGIHLAGAHTDVTLTDLEVTPEDFPAPGICCRLKGEESAALIRIRDGGLKTTRITVSDSRFTGASAKNEDGIAGVDASTMFIQGAYTHIIRVVSSHFLGSFAGEIAYNSIVELCDISQTSCSDFDGCVSSYNDKDIIVRRNVFHDVLPSVTFSAVKVRRNPRRPPVAGVIAYNNTFIGVAGTRENLSEIAVNWHQPTESSGQSGSSVFINNLMVDMGNTETNRPNYGYAVRLAHCPVSLRIDHNGYWKNAGGQDFINAAQCPGGPWDTARVSADPQLDVFYQPPAGNPLCTAGDATYVAWDGDHASGWIGAKECRAAPP
jgi:hypothetical protein